MSNFDLNDFLYNNPLFEEEDKKADKEIEDVFKDAIEDFADDLPNVKADVKEAAPIVVAGASLAVPEILKIIGKVSKKFSSIIGRTGNTGEKIIKVADKLHTILTGVIKKALRAMGAKEGSALDKIVDGLYHVLIASLMLASGAGSVKAFKAGKIAMSSLEAALAAVKSNEVGRFLQDLIGSGTIGEMKNEELEFDDDFGTGGEEVESLAADVVMGRISYKDAREKASKAAFSMKELNNAIAYVEDITGKSAPNYSIGEDDDYDADFEQDDENVGMGYDDEGRPLGEDSKDPQQVEAERKLRDEAMVYYIGKLLDKEIDKLPDNPLQAYLDMLTQDQMDHDAETLSREIGEDKIHERLNISRDALKRLYNEVGATTFSQMILELRDENVLDELVEGMSYQYSGIMSEGLTIGGKKVKAIHTHDSNDVEDHTIEYEDGTEEPYLKHLQMKEARDYRMTYPSYKVEEFNTIGDMAHNGILNLMSFAEQHKPEVVSKIKAVAEEVMNLIYDDMEEFDTQPRIGVKEKKGKDHDGDGDIDSDDYKMAKDKAIKKAMKSETKSAPEGHYFTKSGNLVKGRLSKDARERGATKSDPLDKRRSKIPPVTQVREEDEPTAGQIKSSGGSLASIAGKLAKVAKDMKGLAKEYKVAKEAGDDKKVKDLLATLKVLTAHKKQLEKDLDNA
tara:strand:- start:6053 stop:8089 length:2037 start_codon:yes stop_codon:yes gene_type:complete